MQHNHSSFWNAAIRSSTVAGFVLAVVFLAPDASQGQHQSFFAVANHSVWGNLFDWAAAWCSVKIILLGIGVMIVLDALAHLSIYSRNNTAELATLVLAIIPALLCLFGFYDLAKAIL